jgi:ribosome-binding protein aMBF1 (putative translation factor)
MEKCDICLADSNGKLIIAISTVRPHLNVCKECFNDYANQNYERLTQKLDRRGLNGRGKGKHKKVDKPSEGDDRDKDAG